MPYIDQCRNQREFQVKWVPPVHSNRGPRYQVLEYLVSGGNRLLVGCVHVARTERDANQYIGSRVGGLSLVNGQVTCSKLASKYERAMNQIFDEVCK
jgi:hypothetical protein